MLSLLIIQPLRITTESKVNKKGLRNSQFKGGLQIFVSNNFDYHVNLK